MRTVTSPPATSVEPVVDLLHGIPVTDPYRWLEDQNSPRTRRWVEEQTAYTRGYLDFLPGRDRIRKRVEELLAVESISEPWRVGKRCFYLKRNANQEQPAIMMRDGDVSEEIVLVDPADRGEGIATAVNIINISMDGHLLAYGVRRGGEYSQTVEIIDVDKMQLQPDRLPRGFCYGLVFSANRHGFYYSHEATHCSRPHYRATYWHEFGNEPGADLEIFLAGEDPRLHLALFASTDGALLGYLVIHAGESMTFDLYIQDVFREKPARKVVANIEPVFEPFFAGEQLLAVTNWKAPNLRIVGIDPHHPQRDRWHDVISESQHRIKDFAVVANFICVGYVSNLASRIDVFDLSGHRKEPVLCPPRGTARLLRRPCNSDSLLYEFSSFDHAPTIFSRQVPNGQQEVLFKNQLSFDPSMVAVEQISYKSKDGTSVPMFLVARKGLRRSAPLPTFLTGYGGFGASRTPQFNAYSTLLIEQGFLFVSANLRGGGEFGQEWHDAGKRHNRQNAIDDFIAAAEWLVGTGFTTPGMIAIGGGSNGGLLVGAAMTQRPDLFRVVICLGPLLDMLRYHVFDSAHLFVHEYGSSEHPEDFRHLIAYSPYHRVKDGVPYPAVLLISGDADTCCNPMHVRKMTARIQKASASGHPILLDYRTMWGHAPVQPLSRRIEALTDRLAFICHELGVSARSGKEL